MYEHPCLHQRTKNIKYKYKLKFNINIVTSNEAHVFVICVHVTHYHKSAINIMLSL